MKCINWSWIFCVLFFLNVRSQSVFFEKKFGGSWVDQAMAVKEINGGHLFVAGYSDSIAQNGLYDPYLTRLDKFGNQQWTKYYVTSEDDYGFYLTVLRDGNLLMVGKVNTGSGTGIDALVLKLDTSGNLIWKKIFGGPGAQSLQFADTTADGHVIACGYSATSAGDNDVWVVKLDTAGNVLWQRLHGGSLTDYADCIFQTADGGYVASAVTSSFGSGSTDGWLLRLDLNGDTLWTRTSGDQYAGGCQGVSILKSGDYLLYGEEEIFSGSGFNFWMAKYDDAGLLKWKKNFGGNGTDAIFSVVEAQSGSLYGTGYSNSYNFGNPIDLIIFKTDSLGNMIWKKTYGGPSIDIANDMIVSQYGGLIIAGISNDAVLQMENYVLHVDTMGTLLQSVSSFSNAVVFSVYPTPANDGFYLEYPDELKGSEVNLFDINGKNYFRCQLNSTHELYISTEEIPAGIYCLRAKGSDAVFSRKVIIAH